MDILAGMTRFTRINLFLINPCIEYWGVIVSDWEIKKALDRENNREWTPRQLHLEKGNSLLASMGALGRDFFDLVNEFDCKEIPSFEDPGEGSLLQCLQSDILNLRDRGLSEKVKSLLHHGDTSIQIHSCHSPMREIEVLHDQLLDIFENDPTLLPKDVLVMTPDIESYAPYIQAVFDTSAEDSTVFPFSIADRNAREESQIIDTFLAILNLCSSRFKASQVLAIMETREVHEKFGLTENDIDRIREWVGDTGIRWGIDGDSRGKLDLPSFLENTWKAGLDRLLLGYAMAGQGQKMFNGILPYDPVEGSESLVVGKLLEFSSSLFSLVTSLDEPRSLNEWTKTLTEILERFFSSDEGAEKEIQIIRHVLKGLDEIEAASTFDEKIDLSIVKWHLESQLDKEGFGYGFISSGITFCAMLPMRSIPSRIICLLGMNSGAYPRQSKPLGFDLIAKDPRPGDRSRRNDDRYLFLESILSAREKLYISYVGQSIRDNTSIPPSVLISEMSDYIQQGFSLSRSPRI